MVTGMVSTRCNCVSLPLSVTVMIVAVLLFLCTLVEGRTDTSRCIPLEDGDLTQPAEVWCTLSARVTAKSISLPPGSTGMNSCDLGVEETIVVPWASATLRRILVVPAGKVTEISASQVVDDENNGRVPLKVVLAPMADTYSIAYNVTIFAAQRTSAKTTFVLRYVLEDALRLFVQCPGAGSNELFGLKPPKSESMLMMAWRPGAMAPAFINNVRATMVAPDKLVDRSYPLIGAVGPNGYTTKNESRPSIAAQTEVTLVPARSANDSLVESAFYTLFKVKTGSDAMKCKKKRSCINEKRASKMKTVIRKSLSVTQWLLVALGSILAAFFIALLALCVKRRMKPTIILDDPDDEEADIGDVGGSGDVQKTEF